MQGLHRMYHFPALEFSKESDLLLDPPVSPEHNKWEIYKLKWLCDQ